MKKQRLKLNKDFFLMILSVIAVTFILLGTSFALFTSSFSSNNSHNITAGTLSLTSDNLNADIINLVSVFPIPDAEGIASSGTNFTLTNNGNLIASYELNLIEDLASISSDGCSSNKINYDFINMTINDGEIIGFQDHLTNNNGMLQTGLLTPGSSKKINIKVWISKEKADNTVLEKHFHAKLDLEYTAVSVYTDKTGASVPELDEGMIPITIGNDGVIKKASTREKWFDYSNREWANAVLVSSDVRESYETLAAGSVIDESKILAYFVWVPRYKYKLWNVNGLSNPQSINIEFEAKTSTKSNGSANGEWLTHPAFTFGDTELNGIWVGKFETGGAVNSIKILPNVRNLYNINVKTMYEASRNMELLYANNYGINSGEVDTHLMKNMEWGAVAYLTNSIYGRYVTSTQCIATGCEVWINNMNTKSGTSSDGYWGNTITGCSGASQAAATINYASACSTGYDWKKLGVNASTTGNITGIYDMSGGTYEAVMGNMRNASGSFYPSGSGDFTPDAKYYDSYLYDASNRKSYNRGLLGDATKEVISRTDTADLNAWYSDLSNLPYSASSWLIRGGSYFGGTKVGGTGYYNANGVTSFQVNGGEASSFTGFRIVLTK